MGSCKTKSNQRFEWWARQDSNLDLLRVKLPLQAYVVDCIRRRNPFKAVSAATSALIEHRSAQRSVRGSLQ